MPKETGFMNIRLKTKTIDKLDEASILYARLNKKLPAAINEVVDWCITTTLAKESEILKTLNENKMISSVQNQH